ncbi:MAG: hypothetical protein MHM6MM_001245 [Cercozoa sp. M6MM]
MLNSDQLDKQYTGVHAIRRAVSCTERPPIKQVLDLGVTPRIVNLAIPRSVSPGSTQLRHYSEPELKIATEAVWILTNLVAGTTEEVLAVLNSTDVLVSLRVILLSPYARVNIELITTAVWCVGNLFGDSAEVALMLHRADMMRVLLNVAKNPVTDTTRDFWLHLTWAMANACRFTKIDSNSYKKCFGAVEFFLAVMRSPPDPEILQHAAVAISCLVDGPDERIREYLKYEGAVEVVINTLLNSEDREVRYSCRRTIGNFITGDHEICEYVLQKGVLEAYEKSLIGKPDWDATKKPVKKEAFFLLSNLTAGTVQHVKRAVESPLYPLMLDSVAQGVDEHALREAAYVFANAASTLQPHPELLVHLLSEQARSIECLLDIVKQLLAFRPNTLVRPVTLGVLVEFVNTIFDLSRQPKPFPVNDSLRRRMRVLTQAVHELLILHGRQWDTTKADMAPHTYHWVDHGFPPAFQ